MNPYCWYCNRYVDSDPDHWDDEGCCATQMANHVIERKKWWEEVEASINAENPYADTQNKKAKEDRMNYYDENEAYKYSSRPKWGG